MNTIGTLFRLTSFGESHGPSMGGVIDGMPAGIQVDMEFIQSEMRRRRPGQSSLTTTRKEADEVEFLSGIYQGKTTGTPIGFIVRNTDMRSADYDAMADLYRPSHADYTYDQKYGFRDPRGGGRSSARETVNRVVAGALAKMVLAQLGIQIRAYVQQVGDIALPGCYQDYDLNATEESPVRCPHQETAKRMEALIQEVRQAGDTIGGIISCVITGCPAGLGEPVFEKLEASLAGAMLGINAAKGFEYGSGFQGAVRKGSQENDLFVPDKKGGITTTSNNSGGIQGGISNGRDIYFRVAFKPVATLMQEQTTVDTHGNATVLKPRGRHDACVLPRAVPVVEAMAAIVILDHYLLYKSTQIGK